MANLVSKLIRKARNQTGDLPIASLEVESFQSLRAMTHYANDQYENGYSSVRAIADAFMQIRVKAIDSNGEPYEKTPNVINVLARPNQGMSGLEFKDRLATSTQVYDKVYVLVHERNGAGTIPATENVREDTVAGFTFLQGVVEEYIDGSVRYRVNVKTSFGYEPRVFYPHQVMTFFDVNPANSSDGYSPARAARRWTRIEDYIADYQTGFFENGAVPSGQFIVTAPTTKEYNDIVDNLEKKHRGAGKNNNVVYTYQPIDPNTGKAAQATITWVPFNTTNKDLSLKDILAAVNSKTDSVYRVSAMQRAITDAPNFATAQVDDRNFTEKTVRTFTLKKWSRFQHEMNRITGGLGYGITFDLVTPYIAEEDKFRAETNKITAEALNLLTSKGYTLESSIDALQLPANWKLLKMGTDTKTTITNDKPEVDDGGEVDAAPPSDHSTKHVHGAANGTDPKVLNLTEEDTNNYRQQLEAPASALMSSQIERAVAALDPVDATNDPTDEEIAKFIDDMMRIIGEVLLYGGASEWANGRNMIMESGNEAPDTAYVLSADAEERYRVYLRTIVDSYGADTANSIRSVLDRANINEWTRGETETALRNIMNTDAWRVTRLATSEINRSGAMASIEAMVKIEDESGVSIEKAMMTTSNNPCEYCIARANVWFPVKDVMVAKGEIVTGVDGGQMLNNWDDNMGHDIHANGNCVPHYRVAES